MKSSLNASGLALVVAALATASWAAPLSGGAAHPLVDMESGILLGGSMGGRWVKGPALARSLKGGERYRVYGARSFMVSGKGAQPRSQGAPCDETMFLSVKPVRGEFALGASWNAVPRAPRQLSVDQAAYRAQIAALLKSRGIAGPRVRISQVWRVDLDGDGEAEVLVSASNHKGQPVGPEGISSSANAGDYSIVLLRKMIGGKLKTIILESQIYQKPAAFSAPNEYRVAGVLDANGDGKMEVLVRGRYYEGAWTSVYQVRGDKATQVLSEGCGA